MFKITVSTTRSAMFCLAAACFASYAQADVAGIGSVGGNVPTTVSDALLATTHAANLQHSLVNAIGSAGPATIATAHATTTAANNVRLWDEVIPPAPSPKPTQAALPPAPQPRTAIAIAPTAPLPQVAQMPQASAAMMATNLKVNAGANVTRIPTGFAR